MKEFSVKEAMSVNMMSKQNNEFVALVKQKGEIENGIKNINDELKNIKAGIGFPILRAIGKNVFKTIPIAGKKSITEEMVKQREMMKNALKGVEGQILHKGDEYESASLTVYRFLKTRFINIDNELGEPTGAEMPSVK